MEVFNVDIDAKVIRTKKNVLTDKLEEITLGDYKENIIDTTNKIESFVATVSEMMLDNYKTISNGN